MLCLPARRAPVSPLFRAGLHFGVQTDGSVAANWTCPPGGESYAGIVHGGLLATALDSAMVHALFARGIVARTAELNVRYRHPVCADELLEAVGLIHRRHHRRSFGLLHELEAEIRRDGGVRARAHAKFMASEPVDPIFSDAASGVGGRGAAAPVFNPVVATNACRPSDPASVTPRPTN